MPKPCEHPREGLQKAGHRYRCGSCGEILRPRQVGMNPRARGRNPGARGATLRATGRNSRSRGANPRALQAAYYRLRRESSVLKDGADRLEFVEWESADGMAIRRKGGWELRVYPVDDGIEAALIDPDGTVRTYA